MRLCAVLFNVILGIGVLMMISCTTIGLAPLPEGHPADPAVEVPREAPSNTLTGPEPVDTSPARSDQWDKPSGTPGHHHGMGNKDGGH